MHCFVKHELVVTESVIIWAGVEQTFTRNVSSSEFEISVGQLLAYADVCQSWGTWLVCKAILFSFSAPHFSFLEIQFFCAKISSLSVQPICVSPYEYPPPRGNLGGLVSWARDYFGNGHVTPFVPKMLQETFANAFWEGICFIFWEKFSWMLLFEVYN